MIDKLWSAVSTSLSDNRLGNHGGTVRNIVTTADGKYAATASGDHTGKIWDLQSRKCLSTLGSMPQNLTGGGIGSGHHHIVTCENFGITELTLQLIFFEVEKGLQF
jgi:WD40 repeat protein